MAASKHTKRLRGRYWFCKALDWLVLTAPLLAYIGYALLANEALVTAGGKIGVAGTAMVAAAITAWNFVAQKHLRSPIWIVLIGLYFAMRDVLMPLVIALAISTVLDELVLRPIIANTREKLNGSKVIDSRLGKDIEAKGQ